MTFPNDPGRGERRALSQRISIKGWAFGVIIIVVAVILVLAFVWAGNNNSASSASGVPAGTSTAGGSQSIGSGDREPPARR